MILTGCEKCFDINDYNIFDKVIEILPKYDINYYLYINNDMRHRGRNVYRSLYDDDDSNETKSEDYESISDKGLAYIVFTYFVQYKDNQSMISLHLPQVLSTNEMFHLFMYYISVYFKDIKVCK